MASVSSRTSAAIVGARRKLQKVAREQGNVLAPRPQRRNREREHVEPVVEVRAKPRAGAGRDEIAVGRGDDARVDG